MPDTLGFVDQNSSPELKTPVLWRASPPPTADIEAKLLDGDARAVWRYLPLDIGPDTRDWLRTALTLALALA